MKWVLIICAIIVCLIIVGVICGPEAVGELIEAVVECLIWFE